VDNWFRVLLEDVPALHYYGSHGNGGDGVCAVYVLRGVG
jgi:hypothetical protein